MGKKIRKQKHSHLNAKIFWEVLPPEGTATISVTGHNEEEAVDQSFWVQGNVGVRRRGADLFD